MGTLKVTTYTATAGRLRAGGPNSIRHAMLLKGTSVDGPATLAVINFFQAAQPDTVGELNGNLVEGKLPAEDFPIWYDILRSERPVELRYQEGIGETKLQTITIAVVDEPVGQGPVDPGA